MSEDLRRNGRNRLQRGAISLSSQTVQGNGIRRAGGRTEPEWNMVGRWLVESGNYVTSACRRQEHVRQFGFEPPAGHAPKHIARTRKTLRLAMVQLGLGQVTSRHPLPTQRMSLIWRHITPFLLLTQIWQGERESNWVLRLVCKINMINDKLNCQWCIQR